MSGITLAQYWMGRDTAYALALDVATRRNAVRTVAVANALLERAAAAGVPLVLNRAGSLVASGWRPPIVNAATPGASATSLHIVGEAVDLFDPKGAIDAWLMADLRPLIDLGLWLEHPDYTLRWCHLQTRPPGSGNRVFRPR
jgi:hypothetical protein